MDVKPSTPKNVFRIRPASLMVVIALYLLALPFHFVSAAAPVAVPAIDGDGTLTVSPTSVVYDTATTFTFVFIADSGDFADGSQAVITIPTGWTPPSNSGAGRVLLASHNCTLRSPGAEIAGFTSSGVFVDFGCAQGETFTVTYADANPYKVADSPYTFITTTEVPGGIAPAVIAVSPTVEVTPKPVTTSATALTANDKVYDGTTYATLIIGDLSLTGVVPGDVVSLDVSGATGAFSDKHVGPGKAVAVDGLFLAGADASSYALTQPTLSANITPKPITVVATTDSKVYDGSASSGAVPTLSVGTPLAPGDSEPVWMQTFDNKNAGAGKSLTPAGAVIDGNNGANYTYTFVPDTSGVIGSRPITVTAVLDSKVYDGNPGSSGVPILSAGTPLAPGDTEPAWTQTFDDKNVGVGKTLTPAGAVNDGNGGANYAYTFIPDTSGVITARPVNVSAHPKTKAFGAADPVFTYTVNPALIAGDAFSGALSRAPGEAPGRYDILQGTLSAGGNYAITYVGAKLTITKQRAKNGGFNTYVGASKIPRYWTAAGFTPPDGKSFIKKEGAASVRMAGAAGVTKSLTQTLALSGASGDAFTFSFWIKGTSIPRTGMCRAQVLLYNGNTLKATKTVYCDKGTYGFRQKKLTFTAASAYTKVMIKFTYAKNGGTVWFDAASLLK